ncbi:hypothetical protein VPH35_119890 [Triticum aestivum]
MAISRLRILPLPSSSSFFSAPSPPPHASRRERRPRSLARFRSLPPSLDSISWGLDPRARARPAVASPSRGSIPWPVAGKPPAARKKAGAALGTPLVRGS